MQKVLIVTEEQRHTVWKKALAGIAEPAFHEQPDGSSREIFQAAINKEGMTYIIIDGDYVQDIHEIMFSSMRYMRQRHYSSWPEIIFIAPEAMEPNPLIDSMVHCSICNIVMPYFKNRDKNEDPFVRVPKLLNNPALFSDMYDRGYASVPVLDALVPGSAFVNDQTILGITPKSIAVAGLMPRCGTTTVVLTLASSFALAGKNVSIAMNERDFAFLFDNFSGKVNPANNFLRLDMGKRFLGRVEIYSFKKNAPARRYDDTNEIFIYDMGCVPLTTKKKDQIQGFDNFVSQWVTCTASCLVTGGGFPDAQATADAVKYIYDNHYSASIFMDLCSENQVNRLNTIIPKTKSGRQAITPYRVPAIEGPLSIGKIPEFVKDWAKDNLGMMLKERAKAKNA